MKVEVTLLGTVQTAAYRRDRGRIGRVAIMLLVAMGISGVVLSVLYGSAADRPSEIGLSLCSLLLALAALIFADREEAAAMMFSSGRSSNLTADEHGIRGPFFPPRQYHVAKDGFFKVYTPRIPLLVASLRAQDLLPWSVISLLAYPADPGSPEIALLGISTRMTEVDGQGLSST